MKALASGYSSADSPDLLLLEIAKDGRMEKLDGVRLGDSPSCLAKHGEQVYAACEMPDYARIRGVVIRDGRLVLNGEMTIPGESGLCHLLDTPMGLVGSCYGSGTFFMASHDLSRVLWRWSPGGHAHWVTMRRDRLILADLGKDAVAVATLSGQMLSETCLPADTGPRQWLPWRGDNGALICETSDSVFPARLNGDRIVCGAVPIVMPAAGFPAGACLLGDGRLAVPIRQSGVLVLIGDEGLSCYPLEDPAPRFCHWMGNFLVICYQKSGCFVTCGITRDGIVLLDRLALPGAAWVLPVD